MAEWLVLMKVGKWVRKKVGWTAVLKVDEMVEMLAASWVGKTVDRSAAVLVVQLVVY